MVSYIDDYVKNNLPSTLVEWLLSLGHGGRWWLTTWTTMQRTTLPSTSVGTWWVVVSGYCTLVGHGGMVVGCSYQVLRTDNVKNMDSTTLPSTLVGGYCRWVMVAGGS